MTPFFRPELRAWGRALKVLDTASQLSLKASALLRGDVPEPGSSQAASRW